MIVEALEGWDAQGLKAIAAAATAAQPNAVVALFTTDHAGAGRDRARRESHASMPARC